jgi:adenosine deaminase CECR1
MGSENTDWELEEGLPQFEDPFIQQYLKGRDALIAEEQKRRHGKITVEMLFHKMDIW